MSTASHVQHGDVLSLGSDDSEFVTGEVIPVDGGLVAASSIVADYPDWQQSAR